MRDYSLLRIGEEGYNNNGERMVIKDYRSSTDIDVEFDDGTLRTGITYSNFKSGAVSRMSRDRRKKSKIGDVSYNSKGEKMTVIACRSYTDIDVQFDDGTVRKGVSYDNFMRGWVSKPINRLGELGYNRSGYRMTIIAYRNALDMDVQFDDGTVRHHVTYQSFTLGRILKTPQSVERIGEVRYNKKHERMVIIAYNSVLDIDVQFDDGTIRRGVTYSSFKSGSIPKKGRIVKSKYTDKRIGETRRNNDGLLMRIKGYRSATDIDVEFENGNIRNGVTYQSFKSGNLKDVIRSEFFKSRVGEVGYNNEGFKMIIKDYRSSTDIDVEFEDGEIIRCVRYQNFLRGCVAKTKSRVGEYSINSKGQRMRIKAYRNSLDLDVEFDDGAVRTGVTYQSFKNGQVAKPKCRVGEVSYNSKGEKMTLKVYRGSLDVDVEFDDGAVRTGVTYQNFKLGKVSRVTKPRNVSSDSDKVGEVGYNTRGQRMVITAYRNARDIDVQFDNGYIKKGVFYQAFKRGNVLCDRVGEVNYNSKGERMEIIAYNGSNDIVVRFDDGIERRGVTYGSFERGFISKRPKAKSDSRARMILDRVLGEENTNMEGFSMRVIAYRSSTDIDVQFFDGTVRRHCSYSNFKRGKILKVPRQRRKD